MFPGHDLERSFQEIPRTPEAIPPLAPSRPLYGLVEQAPRLPASFDLEKIIYSASNDESAAYFDQSQSRTMLPEYREASNRTAVVIGESSLMAALPYIPEDTIVVVDKSAAMCAFMKKYIDVLRTAGSPEDWADKMGLLEVGIDSAEAIAAFRFIEQIREWEGSGYPHPIRDEKLFAKVQNMARAKAIIPWKADIASRKDMKRLGKALRGWDANVTMLNITNVLAGDTTFNHAEGYARRLSHLPITPNAPILATTTTKKIGQNPFVPSNMVEATGPFFGLGNLASHGGNTYKPPFGSVVERQYIEGRGPISLDEMGASVIGTLVTAMVFGSGQELQARGFKLGGIIEVSGGSINPIPIEDLPPEVQEAARDLMEGTG